MAYKVALLSFQFGELADISHDPHLSHDFTSHDPLPSEAVQPLVAEAVARIKRSLAATVTRMFNFGQVRILNMSNFIHIAILSFNTQILNSDGSEGQTSIINTIKFYYLEHEDAYKVTLDIEGLQSSSLHTSEPNAFRDGLTNKQISDLAKRLSEEFNLGGYIEATPILKRGRTDMPHYLVSSDERVMEYDFDKMLFKRDSEYQNIKIVSSPSLGNTLLLDNLQNLAEVDLAYTFTLMDRGKVSYKDKEILILGGGDGGLLWELLKERPKFVTMAEIDAQVIEACRDHLRPCGRALNQLDNPEARYKIVIDDCLKVLRAGISEGKKYDVIFNDLTDVPVAKRPESLTAFEPSAQQRDNPWHFIEAIFNLSLECLAPEGLYMNHATGQGNRAALEAYEDFLRNSRVPVEFESRSSYVPSFMEIWVFYTVRKSRALGFCEQAPPPPPPANDSAASQPA